MVNFVDAVTKVSYGKLRTTTPNARGVGNFLHNVALTNKAPFGGLPTLAAEDAMYSMGAKEPLPPLNKLDASLRKAFEKRFKQFEPCGVMQNEIVNVNLDPKYIFSKSIDTFI